MNNDIEHIFIWAYLCALLLSRVWLFATPCSPPGSSVHGILQARILEWVALLQRIFLTQGSNSGLLHCRRILYYLNHQRSPHFPILFVYLDVISCKGPVQVFGQCLHYSSFIICLKVWKFKPSNIVFLNCLDYFGSFEFPYKFQNKPVSFLKKKKKKKCLLGFWLGLYWTYRSIWDNWYLSNALA